MIGAITASAFVNPEAFDVGARSEIEIIAGLFRYVLIGAGRGHPVFRSDTGMSNEETSLEGPINFSPMRIISP